MITLWNYYTINKNIGRTVTLCICDAYGRQGKIIMGTINVLSDYYLYRVIMHDSDNIIYIQRGEM